ncbi:MAG: ExbD/TolR family protein [Marinicella sp.]
MRSHRAVLEQQEEINITPMMDVVFIMLIFFIVTTSFVKEKGLSISRAGTSQPQDQLGKIVSIKLDSQGHSINGMSVPLDGIEARLSQLKAENPDLKAQLFSAKEIKIDTLIRAVDQVKEADITAFSVSTF